MPIYDGGLRSAVLAQARNDADSATQLMRAKDKSVRQVVVSQCALESSLAAYGAAFAAYRKGVGSVSEANLAQSQLLLAQKASAGAYSGAFAGAAALALATVDRVDSGWGGVVCTVKPGAALGIHSK